MSVPQYTIRGIPKEVDARLRALAQEEGRSLNDVVVDRLGVATGWTAAAAEHADLDWFIGSGWPPDAAAAAGLTWLDGARP